MRSERASPTPRSDVTGRRWGSPDNRSAKDTDGDDDTQHRQAADFENGAAGGRVSCAHLPGRAAREPAGPLARTCTYALLVLGPVVLLSIMAAIICYVRLLHGPVSLQLFNERIEQGISAELR